MMPGAAAPPPRLNLHSMIAGPEGLIRTIVAAEIVGPALALRRDNLWDNPRV